MHEALLAHLNIHNAHILAHDLGDSVGQELLARHEFGQQAYGALRIDSITWLNGGMFIEAYTPRTAQKLMSRTPLGDIFSHVQGSPLSRRLLEPTLREMFGPSTKPTRQMMNVFNEILDYNGGRPGAAQGPPVHQRSLHPPQPVGARHAADRGADAVDRRTDRPQLWCPYGAALRRSDTRTRCGDARRRHRTLAATRSARCGVGAFPGPHRPDRPTARLIGEPARAVATIDSCPIFQAVMNVLILTSVLA